jgi:hypothetical protein
VSNAATFLVLQAGGSASPVAPTYVWPPATTRAPLGPLDPDADGCICHHDLPINSLPIIAARPGDGTTRFRRFVRGNWFGNEVDDQVDGQPLPFVTGADSNAPQVMSWNLYKYPAPWQAVILANYRNKGYLDYLLMYADARNDGVSDDQFFALCQSVVAAGLRLVVSWGSKDIDPRDDTADGWPTRALPMLARLIAAQLIDKSIVAFEMDLWNNPANIDGIIRLFAAVCTPAGVYLYVHWSPNHDDWPVSGDRQQWWTSMKGLLRGEMYQNLGSQSVALMQARLDEMLVIFSNIGPADDVGYFDHVAAEAIGEQELYGMTELRGDTINYQLLCTPCTSDGTGPVCVMGCAGGFRMPDGSIL